MFRWVRAAAFYADWNAPQVQKKFAKYLVQKSEQRAKLVQHVADIDRALADRGVAQPKSPRSAAPAAVPAQ